MSTKEVFEVAIYLACLIVLIWAAFINDATAAAIVLAAIMITQQMELKL